MKRILVIFVSLGFLVPSLASAAIGVETTITLMPSPGGNASVSMGTGSNRVAILWEDFFTGSQGTPTIAGVNMTQAGTNQLLFGVRNGAMYYYINPPTGTQTVNDNVPGGNGDGSYIVVLNGVDQIAPNDANGKSSASSVTSLSVTFTVVAANAWMVCGANASNNINTVSNDLVTKVGLGPTMAHSNGIIGTGSQTGTWALSVGNVGSNCLSVKPAAAVPAFWWSWDF